MLFKNYQMFFIGQILILNFFNQYAQKIARVLKDFMKRL